MLDDHRGAGATKFYTFSPSDSELAVGLEYSLRSADSMSALCPVISEDLRMCI